MATVTLHGTTVNTNSELPAVGSTAPDFHLVDSELNDVRLGDFDGKKKILNIVPSLDTNTCAISAKKFDGQVVNYDNTVVLVISGDLPFAQARFCKAAGLKNIIPLSMMRTRGFAKDYGVLVIDGPLAGVTARAIVVLDESNKVVYTQLVTEIADEPDYETALAAL
jgi:thiol peroxidase